MNRKSALLGLSVLAIVGGLRCDDEGGAEGASLEMSVNPLSILANGSDQAEVTITAKGYSGPVLLTTTRGTWASSGADVATVNVEGTVKTLITSCRQGRDADCVGSANLEAKADGAAAFARIRFADAGLGGNGGSGGVGGGGECVYEFDCTPGPDDDGDGLNGCADSDCCTAESCIEALGAYEEAGAGGAGGAPAWPRMHAMCTPNSFEWDCENGIDDDGDGTTDCEDSNCCMTGTCGGGTGGSGGGTGGSGGSGGAVAIGCAQLDPDKVYIFGPIVQLLGQGDTDTVGFISTDDQFKRCGAVTRLTGHRIAISPGGRIYWHESETNEIRLVVPDGDYDNEPAVALTDPESNDSRILLVDTICPNSSQVAFLVPGTDDQTLYLRCTSNSGQAVYRSDGASVQVEAPDFIVTSTSDGHVLTVAGGQAKIRSFADPTPVAVTFDGLPDLPGAVLTSRVVSDGILLLFGGSPNSPRPGAPTAVYKLDPRTGAATTLNSFDCCAGGVAGATYGPPALAADGSIHIILEDQFTGENAVWSYPADGSPAQKIYVSPADPGPGTLAAISVDLRAWLLTGR